MQRATLDELDGLSATDAKRMSHPVELMKWSERGWYKIEDDVFRLTPAGKARAAECCAKCGAWKGKASANGPYGECWSMDRLDGDESKGPADITAAYEFCEAFEPRQQQAT